MNERANELIKSIPDLRYDASTGLFETDRRALYDFAELIVRECAEWIKNTDSDPNIGEEDAKALLEHFGVEE